MHGIDITFYSFTGQRRWRRTPPQKCGKRENLENLG